MRGHRLDRMYFPAPEILTPSLYRQRDVSRACGLELCFQLEPNLTRWTGSRCRGGLFIEMERRKITSRGGRCAFTMVRRGKTLLSRGVANDTHHDRRASMWAVREKFPEIEQ